MRKKSFLVSLLFALALSMATVLFAVTGCQPNDNPPANGAYYLSVYEAGSWTNYSDEDKIPADKKFVKEGTDGNIYTLTVDLDKGASVKIAQVGSDKTYGGDELFSGLTALEKGENNAIAVKEAGKFGLKLDADEGEITYTFRAKEETPPPAEAKVILVEIDNKADFILTFGAETTKQLSATATYDNETTATTGISWTSSDTAVATVSESGLVTAVSAGTAQIKAKSGTVESDALTVTVNGAVTLDKETLTLNVNGEETLTATAVGGAVKGEWSSTDETVATVDQNGKITALKAGSTTIRLAYTPRTGATPLFATCAVTVNTPVTAIALSNNAITVSVDSNATLSVSVIPDDATDKNYTFAVSEGGNEFITVAKSATDGTKLVVTAVKTGTATVTVTSEDGNYTADCVVTVVEKGTATVNISASSLSLNKAGTNTEAELTVTVDGDTIDKVEWESSATGVATVTGNGEQATVTSKGFGTATVKATVTTVSGGSYEKTCNVRVAPAHFFLYGDVGATTWTTELDKLEEQGMVFAENDGIYTLTYDLPEGKNFRIGDDDDFGTTWVGLNNGHLTSGQNIEKVSDDKNNMKANKAGTYTLTVDITGATPTLTIVCDAVAVTGIAIDAENKTLNAGDEEKNAATVTLTVKPEDATFTAADIVWTCESDKVTLVEAEDKLTATVTAKDNAEGGTVTVSCAVKGKEATLNLTVIAQGAQVVPVSSIEFEEQAYSLNLNGASAWAVTVSAKVNSDATNQTVTYGTADSGVTVDAATGAVTASKVGTYTVTATAAGDSTKTAEVKVTFYSDMFYLTGDANGWGDAGTADTTAGTKFENYTFTANNTNTQFTLDVVLTTGKPTFKIMFCGTNDWTNNALTGAHLTKGCDAANKGGNIAISEDGVYTVTIDLSAATPAVTVTRKGAMPVFTAKLLGGEEEIIVSEDSTSANNRYAMSFVAAFDAEKNYTIQIISAGEVKATISSADSFEGNENFFGNAEGAFKCLAAGNYRFDFSCNASGNANVTVSAITSSGPVESDAYVLKLSGSSNGWTPTEIDGATLYYDASEGEYIFYFSREMTVDEKIGFVINEKDSTNKIELWKSNLDGVTLTDSDGWLKTSGDNIQPTKAGTMYGKLVFKSTGVTSLEVSSTNLAPVPPAPVESDAYTLSKKGDGGTGGDWTAAEISAIKLYYDESNDEYIFYFSTTLAGWEKFGFDIHDDNSEVAWVYYSSDGISFEYEDTSEKLTTQWGSFQVNGDDGVELYGKLVFTVSEDMYTIVSLTMSSTDLNPATPDEE